MVKGAGAEGADGRRPPYWKEFSELEGIVGREGEELEEYDPEEDDWRSLEGD